MYMVEWMGWRMANIKNGFVNGSSVSVVNHKCYMLISYFLSSTSYDTHTTLEKKTENKRDWASGKRRGFRRRKEEGEEKNGTTKKRRNEEEKRWRKKQHTDFWFLRSSHGVNFRVMIFSDELTALLMLVVRTPCLYIIYFFFFSFAFSNFYTSVPRCIIHNETLLCKWIEYKCTHQINYSTRRDVRTGFELNDTNTECMHSVW